MLHHLVIAAAGIAGLFAMWTAVQKLMRRSDPRFSKDDDVLAGCGTCAVEGLCRGAGTPTGDCPDPGARLNADKE